MKMKNFFMLGMLAVLLVFGFFGTSCAALTGAAISGAAQGSQNRRTATVIAHAISEIEKVLPSNAVVWINKGRESAGYNRNAIGVVSSTAGAADTAVDDITAAFIQKGIRLVDRSNTALIQAEQRYQSSGNVSEQDILSAGAAAGANILVTVSVVPQGNNQRLQIRVMDIEKGIPLMQSGSGNEWRL